MAFKPSKYFSGFPDEIDSHVLSLAEDKLCEMITPFEEKLGDVPWVKVSGLDILPFVLMQDRVD